MEKQFYYHPKARIILFILTIVSILILIGILSGMLKLGLNKNKYLFMFSILPLFAYREDGFMILKNRTVKVNDKKIVVIQDSVEKVSVNFDDVIEFKSMLGGDAFGIIVVYLKNGNKLQEKFFYLKEGYEFFYMIYKKVEEKNIIVKKDNNIEKQITAIIEIKKNVEAARKKRIPIKLAVLIVWIVLVMSFVYAIGISAGKFPDVQFWLAMTFISIGYWGATNFNFPFDLD